MTLLVTPLDLRRAYIAKAWGMQNSLRIIIEARRAGLPPSLAFAVIEQESGNGANVFGHDPPPNGLTGGWGGVAVTEKRYRAYKSTRGARGLGGMQGVGPAQLTWYELQDKADALGGAWIPRHNIRVAFEHLAALIEQHGSRWLGIKAYNGAGPVADRYVVQVTEKQAAWHKRLGPKGQSK